MHNNRSVPLPDNEDSSNDPLAEPVSGWGNHEAKDGPVVEAVRRTIASNHHLYVVKVRLQNNNVSAFIFLLHFKKFTNDEMKKMLAEANACLVGTVTQEEATDDRGRKYMKIVPTGRLATRRSMMAQQRVPVEKPRDMNELHFVGDAEFIEGVMCDKFDFRKLIVTPSEIEIEGTVKGS